MHFFLEKIRTLKLPWNERPLTEDDFFRLCRRHKIVVQEMPLRTNGFYYSLMGRHYIVVDSRLDRIERTLVMFHEFAHYLMHVPDTGATANFHGVGKKTRKECEADAFALCALMPRKWLETRLPDEIIGDEGIPADYVAQRFALYARYGQ